MQDALTFTPFFALPVMAALAAGILVLTGLALWRGLAGWWLRALAGAVLLFALMGPSWQVEDRDYMPDIAFLVVDESASQELGERPAQMAEAEAEITTAVAAMGAGPRAAPVDLRILRVGDATGDGGTKLVSALAAAAAEVSPDRIAGAILLSDGVVHDADALADFPAPVHLLTSGQPDDWDRRLVMETVPAFAILGEPVEIMLKVEALGEVPAEAQGPVALNMSIDGSTPRQILVPVNKSVALPLELTRAGLNVLHLTFDAAPGELTAANNAAVVAINGIRDRLRVLLVSGEPYAGERTWRNLLKADSAVDLVHFTILRPPEKQDGVPVFELSLIAFPTRELFMDKVDEFDLIIFDRYRRRGVLPGNYLENIGRYVRDGGALLIASGPAFAGAESLYRTPLRDVLPAAPTARIIEGGFHPRVSETGKRHPVTRDLERHAPRTSGEDGTPGWGRWFRLVEMVAQSGTVVMEDDEGRPLLVLDRVGEGRIAMLASDQAWLWSRGYEGGGPQLELLRRLAHWLMKEPELEEEVLVAEPDGINVTVTRRSLGEAVGDLTVQTPSGQTMTLTMTEVTPGEWQTRFEAAENGIYRLAEGALETVTAVGPAAPKEFENPLATDAILAPLIEASGGGSIAFATAGTPDIRRVREGRVAAGRNWLGLVERRAYSVRDIRQTPLAPGWLLLMLSAGLVVLAWRVEGR